MEDEPSRIEELKEIYDDRGRLKEPDGQAIKLREKEGEVTYCLMPTAAYVSARSLHYAGWCLGAIGLAVLGSAVHWLVARPDDGGRYVITVAFITVGAALAVRIWNATIRAGITLRVAREVRLKVATVKVVVRPGLRERIGIGRSDDGRFWHIHHIPERGAASLRFKLAHEAFPELEKFLDDTAGEAWQRVD